MFVIFKSLVPWLYLFVFLLFFLYCQASRRYIISGMDTRFIRQLLKWHSPKTVSAYCNLMGLKKINPRIINSLPPSAPVSHHLSQTLSNWLTHRTECFDHSTSFSRTAGGAMNVSLQKRKKINCSTENIALTIGIWFVCIAVGRFPTTSLKFFFQWVKCAVISRDGGNSCSSSPCAQLLSVESQRWMINTHRKHRGSVQVPHHGGETTDPPRVPPQTINIVWNILPLSPDITWQLHRYLRDDVGGLNVYIHPSLAAKLWDQIEPINPRYASMGGLWPCSMSDEAKTDSWTPELHHVCFLFFLFSLFPCRVQVEFCKRH